MMSQAGHFLREGIERRWRLIEQLNRLGNARPWAHFRAHQPLEITDFEGVEAAIRKVEARRCSRPHGTGFLSPQVARRGAPVCLIQTYRFYSPHEAPRLCLEEAREAGNPVRIARTEAELARAFSRTTAAPVGPSGPPSFRRRLTAGGRQ